MESAIFVVIFIVFIVIKAASAAAKEKSEKDRRDKAKNAWRTMEKEGGTTVQPSGKSELQKYLEDLQGKQEPARRRPPVAVPVAVPVAERGESTTRSVFDCEHEEDEVQPVRDGNAEIEAARRAATDRAEEARRYRAGSSRRRSSIRPMEPIVEEPAPVSLVAAESFSLEGGLSAADARRGVVMAEVLGPPRAIRPYGKTGYSG